MLTNISQNENQTHDKNKGNEHKSIYIQCPWYHSSVSLCLSAGIKSLISVNKIPQAISNNFIQSLINRCDKKGIIKTNQEIVAGQKIKIKRGPFSQMVALVDHVDAQERVTLLLTIMGHETKVTIDEKIL